MKNSDYVLRLESPLSGETNSYSSFFIHHSSFNELFTKNRKRNSYSSFFILHSSFNEPRHRIEYNNYNNIKNKHKKRL